MLAILVNSNNNFAFYIIRNVHYLPARFYELLLCLTAYEITLEPDGEGFIGLLYQRTGKSEPEDERMPW